MFMLFHPNTHVQPTCCSKWNMIFRILTEEALIRFIAMSPHPPASEEWAPPAKRGRATTATDVKKS